VVTYSTNFMGPISKDWYEKRGLTEHYAGGRIDIRDDTKEGYEGWSEYALPVMHGEDWNALSEYLDDLETETLVEYDDLIAMFEDHYGKKIRWAE
jgi:hypothetical protein